MKNVREVGGETTGRADAPGSAASAIAAVAGSLDDHVEADDKRQRTSDPSMVPRSMFDQTKERLEQIEATANDLRNVVDQLNMEKLELQQKANTGQLENNFAQFMSMFTTAFQSMASSSSQSSASLQLEQQRLELEARRFELETEERNQRNADRLKREAEAKQKLEEKRQRKEMESIPKVVDEQISSICDLASRKYRAGLKANSTKKLLAENLETLGTGKYPVGLPRYGSPWEWEELDKPALGCQSSPQKIEVEFKMGMTRRECIRHLHLTFLQHTKAWELEAANSLQESNMVLGSLDQVKKLVSEIEFKTSATPPDGQAMNVCTDVEIWKLKATEVFLARCKLVEKDILKAEKSAADIQKKELENRTKAERIAPENVMVDLVRKVVREEVLPDLEQTKDDSETPEMNLDGMEEDEVRLQAQADALAEYRRQQKLDESKRQYEAEKKEAMESLRMAFSPVRSRSRGRGSSRGGRGTRGRARARGRGMRVASNDHPPKGKSKGKGKYGRFARSMSKNGSSPSFGGQNQSKGFGKSKGKGKGHGKSKNGKGGKHGGKGKERYW